MNDYIVIVRDFDARRYQPSDEDLYHLNRLYRSPIVSIDWENNRDKAIDAFDEKYRKYFSRFLYPNYELIEI